MRELKITAGFMLSIFGLGIALAVGGPIYRSNASMAVFVVIVSVCVVCTVAGLMLLESAGLYKWSKGIQLAGALSLILVAWDVSAAGLRTHISSSMSGDITKAIPMELDKLFLIGMSTAVFLFGAWLLLAKAFMFRPMSPRAGRIIKLSVGLLLLLMVIPSLLEANKALAERSTEEILVPVKMAYLFVAEVALAGVVLLLSGALPQPKASKK
ncbi:MAG: hypothetical protein AABM67_16790 [Acidobacteriota bacterium]